MRTLAPFSSWKPSNVRFTLQSLRSSVIGHSYLIKSNSLHMIIEHVSYKHFAYDQYSSLKVFNHIGLFVTLFLLTYESFNTLTLDNYKAPRLPPKTLLCFSNISQRSHALPFMPSSLTRFFTLNIAYSPRVTVIEISFQFGNLMKMILHQFALKECSSWAIPRVINF